MESHFGAEPKLYVLATVFYHCNLFSTTATIPSKTLAVSPKDS